MEWRPDNWENPHIGESNTPWVMAYQRDSYEKGADAMLEALRATGVWWDEMVEKGRLVFIPDKEATQ